MPEQKPAIQKMKAAEVGKSFEQLLKQVSSGDIRVVVDEDGTTLGAIISAEDLARLSQMENRNKKFFAILDEIG
jgi:prevent-host-death family protein